MKNCLLFLILFASCTSSAPDKLLPVQKMKSIVWDLMQVDEVLASKFSLDTNYKPNTERPVMYERVYKQHDVTEDQFIATLHYYEKYPEKELKVLVDSLISYGNRVRSNADSLKPKTYPQSKPNISPTLDSFKKKNHIPS